MTLTYKSPATELTGSSSTLANLVGGETIELDGAFDCNGASVEFVEARDSCVAGTHMCHSQATCTPTEDGLDYTANVVEIQTRGTMICIPTGGDTEMDESVIHLNAKVSKLIRNLTELVKGKREIWSNTTLIVQPRKSTSTNI